MHQVQPLVVAGFNVPGHNMGDDLLVPEAGSFITEKTLDSSLASVVPAKDMPHLTLNDKVFAARYGTGNTPPKMEAQPQTKVAPAPVEPEPEPKPAPAK